jgi:serine/threonine protein kinase
LPNIISVIEADFADDYIYIVSEYAEGGSLQKWLAANGGKSVDNRTSRYDYARNPERTGLSSPRGIYSSRHSKPANILIRKGTFCLADFGVHARNQNALDNFAHGRDI